LGDRQQRLIRPLHIDFALTIIDARTRPEIASRMPIRMIAEASYFT
jgi:hypothetical protein